MRRPIVFAASCALLLAFAASPAVANAGRGGPVTTTYVSVTCFVDAPEFEIWATGFGDQVEHARAVFINELWVYDGTWRMVGTETDTVMDVSNTRTGTELFRGSWVLGSSLGDFAGTFMWTENRSGAGGVTVGHATDGSGLLWKATPAVVDPDTTGGVPACAVDREVHDLTLVEIVAP